ncbi:MAG: PEP-CTERM sorting domain-containing protein [bacterium]|nr:PEP-CTERM sorting domain-containing protein [bacterium]
MSGDLFLQVISVYYTPEPGALMLLGLGLAGLAAAIRGSPGRSRLTDRRSAASNSADRSRPSRDNMTPDCNQGQSKRAVGGPLQRFGRRPPDGIVKRRVPLWTNFICRHERIYDWH